MDILEFFKQLLVPKRRAGRDATAEDVRSLSIRRSSDPTVSEKRFHQEREIITRFAKRQADEREVRSNTPPDPNAIVT